MRCSAENASQFLPVEVPNAGEPHMARSEAMGVQRLRARTPPGLELKRHASLLALTIANAA